LILTSPKTEIWQYLNTLFSYNIFRNLGGLYKNVGKSISSKLDDKFKFIFRILIASLNQ